MSNLELEVIEPEPVVEEVGAEPSFVQYLGNVTGYTFSVLKVALYLAPVAVVTLIILLALLGPAVGNVFSNIVSSL